jgi:excisionase family DNA binding protein
MNKGSNEQPSQLLTVKEVAALLKTSVPFVRHLQQNRYLSYYKIGTCVRFAKAEIDEYVQKAHVKKIERDL